MTFYVTKYKIVHSISFESELYQIVQYFAYKLHEPNISKEFYKNVKSKINSLCYLPERYSKIELSNKIYRKLPINKYIVIYEVNNNTRTSFYLTYFSW